MTNNTDIGKSWNYIKKVPSQILGGVFAGKDYKKGDVVEKIYLLKSLNPALETS